MAIDVLVEALLLSKGHGTECKPLSKDEKGLKEWIRNNLKAMSSLLGKLGMKSPEA